MSGNGHALESVSAIGEALRDGAGKVNALTRGAQESARGVGQSALAFAKRNPVPLALVGAGAACTGLGIAFWLLGDRDALKDRAQHVAHDATAKGQRVATMAEQRFREHPLAVGAAMLAVGTAIGAALPSTVREAHWLGERRDALIDRARDAARGAVKKMEALAVSPAK